MATLIQNQVFKIIIIICDSVSITAQQGGKLLLGEGRRGREVTTNETESLSDLAQKKNPYHLFSGSHQDCLKCRQELTVISPLPTSLLPPPPPFSPFVQSRTADAV